MKINAIKTLIPAAEDGAPGADSINVIVTGETIVFTEVGQINKVYVDAFLGQTQIGYDGDTFACSSFSGSTLMDGHVAWSFMVDDDKRFYYVFKLLDKADLDGDLDFTVTLNGVDHKRPIHISTAFDGDKGDRGPALRGPQNWEDVAVGYSFEAGGEDEDFQDVVIYKDNYYVCAQSHTKTASNDPKTEAAKSSTTALWKIGSKFDLVATKILLADYALIKNLGAEALELYDKDGNTIFKVAKTKDSSGNEVAEVTCNTGTFKNIVVTDGTFTGTVNAAKGYVGDWVLSDKSLVNSTKTSYLKILNDLYSLQIGGSAQGLMIQDIAGGDAWFGLRLDADMYLATGRALISDGEIEQKHINVATGYTINPLTNAHNGCVVTGTGTLTIYVKATNHLDVELFCVNACKLSFKRCSGSTNYTNFVYKGGSEVSSQDVSVSARSVVHIFCKDNVAYIARWGSD